MWLFFLAEVTEFTSDVLIREESGEVDTQGVEAGLTAKAKEQAQHKEDEEEGQSSCVQETPSHPEVQYASMFCMYNEQHKDMTRRDERQKLIITKKNIIEKKKHKKAILLRFLWEFCQIAFHKLLN